MEQEIILSEEQENACAKFGAWLEKFKAGTAARPYFVLEGYAGTGKSFSLKTIIDRYNLRPHYMTYTGKAALVLNRYSDVGATTIHSAIYKLRDVSEEVFRNLYEKLELTDDPDEKHEIKLEIKNLQQPQFDLDLDAFDGSSVNLFALDECSMVDSDMLQDLIQFDIPIIALGDSGQLPPVKGTGALFSGSPDASLTEIRRQALDNPIIEWSMKVRKRITLTTTPKETMFDDRAALIPKAFIRTRAEYDELFDKHDIVLCWKNATRRNLNGYRRHSLGYESVFPTEGERLIVTKNDRTKGIVNGQFLIVESVGNILDNYVEIEAWPEDEELRGKHPIPLNIMRACFEEYQNPDVWDGVKPWDYKGTQQADYGYAITCHKAQGSQWERVLVFDEDVFKWNKEEARQLRAQWLYTAITRASEKVTIVAGK